MSGWVMPANSADLFQWRVIRVRLGTRDNSLVRVQILHQRRVRQHRHQSRLGVELLPRTNPTCRHWGNPDTQQRYLTRWRPGFVRLWPGSFVGTETESVTPAFLCR